MLALAAGSVVLYAVAVGDLRPLAAPWHLPWVALVPLFYVAESHVVHLELRGEAHSFSLGELPTTLALFFGGPHAFVAAQLLGAGAAFVFTRRQKTLKVAFNLAHYALESVVAVVVFFALVPATDPISPRGWVALVAASGSSALLGELLVAAAIASSGGGVTVRELVRGIATGLAITATNSCIALVAILLLWRDPEAAGLLAAPSAMLLLAYRAYTRDRQKEERIELLRRSASAMQGSADVEAALEAFLDHAREMFRSETARLVLLPDAPADLPVETSLGPGGYTFMATVAPPRAGQLRAAGDHREAALLGPLADGRRDGMVAPVSTGERRIGILVVENRLGDVSTFDDEDVRLFDTLARHLAVSLEKGRLEESLAEVGEIQKDLEHRALHDALTGLPNRVLFLRRLEEAFVADAPVTVLGIDLDGFKAVNDTMGHEAGDQLLRAVGERLAGCLRPEDTAARFGGDEFAVLLSGSETQAQAAAVAQRVIESIMRPVQIGGRETFVGASVGIALRSGAFDAETLMEQADAAMYSAKASGKGRFVLFEKAMLAERERRAEMKRRIDVALAEDQFVLNFQPVVDMRDGAVWGAEALIRWDHPELGLVTPGEFLDVAEETGQIVPLGEWVLDEATRRLAEWHRAFGPRALPRIAVNLSERQLLQAGLPAAVGAALSKHDLPEGAIVLELQEAALLGDAELVAGRLEELHAAGARLSIDDFGNGLSSIGQLTSLPIDVLKIDRAFVDGARHDAAKSDLARAIVALAAAIGSEAVAQGVETPDEEAHLRSLGFTLGQGYLFEKPVDAQTMGRILGAAPDRARVYCEPG